MLTFNLVLFVTGEVSNKLLTFVFQGNSQNVTLIGATLEVGSLCSMSFIRQWVNNKLLAPRVSCGRPILEENDEKYSNTN